MVEVSKTDSREGHPGKGQLRQEMAQKGRRLIDTLLKI
jgi:hypothetical protein